jgi:hypothetical protein
MLTIFLSWELLTVNLRFGTNKLQTYCCKVWKNGRISTNNVAGSCKQTDNLLGSIFSLCNKNSQQVVENGIAPGINYFNINIHSKHLGFNSTSLGKFL